MGDGHSQASVITCGSYDKGYLCEAINKSKYELGSVRQDERTGAFSIGIKNGFWNSLKKLNLIKNKHVPSAYLRGSISQRRALLQGLMDSDGHIDKARGRAHFHNTNINLSDAVAELAYSLGEVVHRATKRQHGFGKDCVSHAVFWQPTFCCVRNPRHRENYTPRKITPYRAIQNIERISSVHTKCIAVDSDTSTYLAGKSMAVTHNTVVRAMFKYLPVSNEIMRYSEKDAVIKKDISEDEGEIYIDIEPQQNTQTTVSDAPEQPTIEMPAALMDLHRAFPEEFRMALQQLNIETITDEHVEPITKRVNMILDEQQAAEMMPE